MLKVLHNPRCGKARNCLAFLDENQIEYQIIKYLENPLSKSELKQLLKKLKLKPIEIIRQKEPIWLEKFSSKTLTDNDIFDALIEFPILLQRPIIIDDDKAFIARETDIIRANLK